MPIAGTNWFLGTGRRKESIARVFLRAGSGKFTINKRTVEQYFPNFAWKHDATEPLKFTSLTDQVDVVVTANGGGVGGQAGGCAWDCRARLRSSIRSCDHHCERTVF